MNIPNILYATTEPDHAPLALWEIKGEAYCNPGVGEVTVYCVTPDACLVPDVEAAILQGTGGEYKYVAIESITRLSQPCFEARTKNWQEMTPEEHDSLSGVTFRMLTPEEFEVVSKAVCDEPE